MCTEIAPSWYRWRDVDVDSSSSFRRNASLLRGVVGFTLLEMMMAMTLLVIVAGLSFSIITATTSAWNAQKARSSAFSEARVVFETLTQQLSQATLNTYWDYNNRGNPSSYLRKSELHFIQGKASELLPSAEDASSDAVFFIAPLGICDNAVYQPLSKMLTACGFYVRFADATNRPEFLEGRVQSRFRFRLYQFVQPGEDLGVYASDHGNDWFQNELLHWSFPMAENVIGLILRAKYSDANGDQVRYSYDSRLNPDLNNPPATHHQLPPVISVTLVVIDENSARRLADKYGSTPPAILPDSTAFLLPESYDQDLSAWESKLQSFVPKISYRIFSANVQLRGAKWSSN